MASVAQLRNNPIHDPALDALDALDWDDQLAVQAVTYPLLEQLAADPARLAASMRYVARDPILMARCETDHFFHRVVLYEDLVAGFSVRLQFVKPSTYDRPHCHRATFAARILAGGYIQSTFALPPHIELSDPSGLLTPEYIKQMRPVSVRAERPGDSYVIHHTCYHSTLAEQGHASVVVRGPAAKDMALFLDQRDGTYTWVKAGKLVSPERLAELRMTQAAMEELTSRIEAIGDPAPARREKALT